MSGQLPAVRRETLPVAVLPPLRKKRRRFEGPLPRFAGSIAMAALFIGVSTIGAVPGGLRRVLQG